MTERLVERAHACWEKDCKRTWVTFMPAPDTACPWCGSKLVTFEVREPGLRQIHRRAA